MLSLCPALVVVKDLGYRTYHPAGIVIEAALPRNGLTRKHMPTIPYAQVADCIAKVKASRQAILSSKLALQFLILTAPGRGGGVRDPLGMRPADFNPRANSAKGMMRACPATPERPPRDTDPAGACPVSRGTRPCT